ncbi:MAG: hypothetical protein NZ908_02180 [Candidatus Micrarchaeota archaeon]|nr:hypothetical protein [Candidatus Micrarchaeota archaeon]
MILLLVGLVLSFALYPPGGSIISTQPTSFYETFFAFGRGSSCGSIQPPAASLSCILTVYDGGFKNFPGGCSWIETNCSCINTGNTTCTKSFSCRVSIQVSGLSSGEGYANLSCDLGYASSSNPLLFDFRDPEIYEMITNPPSPFYQEQITFRYCVRDDNPDIECNISLNNIVISTDQISGNNGCISKQISLNWGNHRISVRCADKTRYPRWIGLKRVSERSIDISRHTTQTASVSIIQPEDLFATNNTTTKPVVIKFRVTNSPTERLDCRIVDVDTSEPLANIHDVLNNSEVTYRIPENIDNGVYKYRVECTDRGPRNVGRSEIRRFIVDREPPAVRIVYPVENSQVYDNPVNLRGRVEDSIPSPNQVNCTFSMNPGSSISFPNQPPVSDISHLVNLNPNSDTITLSLTCTDMAGNTNSTTVRFRYVDGVPPTIRPIFPIGTSVNTDTTELRVEVNDAGSYTCTFNWTNPSGVRQNRQISGTGNRILAAQIDTSTAGNYVWSVECVDAKGNIARTDMMYFSRSLQQSSGGNQNIMCSGNNSNNRMQTLFGIVAIIGIMFIALGYMFGNILNNQEILLGVKGELRSYVVTILVFVFVLAVTETFYCAHMNDLIDRGRSNVSYLSNKMSNITYSLARIYSMSSILSSITPLEWSTSMFIIELNHRENFNKKIYEYATNVQGILNLFTSIVFNLNYYTRLVEFLVQYSYTFLLYLALIARIIPMTKRIGSTLLGISLTIIFILPFTYNVTTSILVSVSNDIINILLNRIKIVEAKLSGIYFDIVQKIDFLSGLAVWNNILLMTWTFAKFGYWLFLQVCQVIGICYPIAYPLFTVWGDMIYAIFKMIFAIVWSITTLSINQKGVGGTQDMIEAYETLLDHGTMTLLAFMNLIQIVYYLINIIVVIVSIRSISLLGGGDYFLYGIEERI